jgi:hypothetical protein
MGHPAPAWSEGDDPVQVLTGASSSDLEVWATIILGVLNVGQTVALAYMAGRSRRIRRNDG